MRLAGKRAVITGGGRGIGKAYVERFLREGAQVVIGDLDVASAEQTTEELSGLGKLSFIALDVSDEASVADGVACSAEAMGGIDIVVNNAGLLRDWDRNDDSYANLQKVFAVNLHSAWLVTRAAAPHLIKSQAGRIINQASTAAYNYRAPGSGDEPFPGLSSFSYAQAKRGVVGFTKFAAGQLAHWGVTVNCIAPGVTHTAAMDIVPKEQLDRLMADQPIKGAIMPGDLAGTVVFFASDEAKFITGQTIVVDGGRFMPA